MKTQTPARILLAVLLSTLCSGCALTRQIKYDPERMPVGLGRTGKASHLAAALEKNDVTKLLGGADFTELDPVDFSVDTRNVERIFGQADDAAFSFVLVADVQIEDRSLRFDPCLTGFLDKSPMEIETTVRGFYADHADVFYVGFILKAIREGMEMNTNVAAVIGLGDALQLGREAELATFNEMIGKFLIAGRARDWEDRWSGTWLETPIRFDNRGDATWLNLIGNHDCLLLGNFTCNFPVHAPRGGINSLARLESTLRKTQPFNSASHFGTTNALGHGTRAAGYCHVDRTLPDGKRVRLVMLNTNERNLLDPLIPKLQRGALYPSVSGEQFDWLRATLASAQADESVALVLVFGHNQLAEITVNRTGKRADRDSSFGEFRALLGEFPKVKAYFCGHLHSGSPPKEHRFGRHVVIEYTCPSIQEFPKSFGLASVRKDPHSGEYATSVRYFNLEDVLDLNSLPPVNVSEDSGPRDQQRRFCDWLCDLEKSASSLTERLQLLAKYCYASAANDVRNDLRKDISLCFHPKYAAQLMDEYAGAQNFWTQLKTQPQWKVLRNTLDALPQAAPEIPIAAGP